MKYLVVYAHENGFGNVDCKFNHNPPKMCDIRKTENEIQRTNQFNLSGKRYSKQEILDIIKNKTYDILTISVSDKYGEMGIVGAVIYEKRDGTVIIRSFYLSCRAFGRGFENLMLEEVKKYGETVLGIYNETDKNKKHRSFYEDNGVSLYGL